MKQDFVFVSESVTEGHPDKLCDQISDAILDQFLREDPFARAIIECAVSTGVVFVDARYRSSSVVDIPYVVRQIIAQVGYEQKDFNPRTTSIMTSINELPPDQSRHDERNLSEAEIDAEFLGLLDVGLRGAAKRRAPDERGDRRARRVFLAVHEVIGAG